MPAPPAAEAGVRRFGGSRPSAPPVAGTEWADAARDPRSRGPGTGPERPVRAAKYAGASAARIRLAQEDGHLSFSIADDGCGFDPAAIPPGSGTQNMIDRLAALGGTVEIRSAPGAGTTVLGRIPVG